MKFESLQEFITLATVGEFNTAAKQLKISQPTLSKHIRQFELLLGIPLFVRSTKGVILNEYGKAFLPYAKSMLHERDAFIEQLQRQKSKKMNSLSIGYIYSTLLYGGVDVINNFAKENPDITISVLMESLTGALMNELEEGGFDFIFRYEHETLKADGSYERLLILTDNMTVAVPETHAFAQRDQITIAELRDENLIMWPRNSVFYNMIHHAFHACGLEPKIERISHDAAHIQEQIIAGYGISLLPRKRSLTQLDPRVILVDFVPELNVELVMLYKRPLTPQGERFLEYMKNNLIRF